MVDCQDVNEKYDHFNNCSCSKNNVIGYRINFLETPGGLIHFKKMTMGHHIIMGQKTHESIGKTLPGRTNIVLTFDAEYKSRDCIIVTSIEEALRVTSAAGEKEVFIIGGASIYKQFIGIADKLYITKIHKKFKGDVIFPEIDPNKWGIESIQKNDKDNYNLYRYDFIVYKKIVGNKI
jgi:dihydrofolate reductase